MKTAVKTPEDMQPGTVYATNSFGNIEVIKYHSWDKVDVKFKGYCDVITTQAGNVRNGHIKNPIAPNVKGVGYLGNGVYNPTKHKKAYLVWKSMITRCYCKEYHKKQPTYEDCSVAEDWHSFQVFAKWFYRESNFKDGLHLDKDILEQGNKQYGPKTCVFIAQSVNSVITDSKAVRGLYRAGVSHTKGRYRARCSDGTDKSKHLGYFNTEMEAHSAYCKYKYALLVKLASEQEEESIKQGLLNWVISEY